MEKPWRQANVTCAEASASLHATRVRRTHVGEDSHEGALTRGSTHVGQLAGRLFAAPILLQASVLVGAQDFGGWAVPFGFCHMEREELSTRFLALTEEPRTQEPSTFW